MSIRCDLCLNEYDSDYKACPYCGFVNGNNPVELFYLRPGTVLIDRYAVGQVLGYGGFGIIYKTWDIKEKKIVAIKEYYPSGIVTRIPGRNEIKLLSDNRANEFEAGKRRFIEEPISIVKFKDHPNIVSILGNFIQNNTAYYVMEYLEGMSLSKYLEGNIKLGVEDGVGIILSICDAVKTVHRAGILHRDISPDNIIIPTNFPDVDVKLIDFGAARFSPDSINTQDMQIMKPGYSPPEQYISGNKENEQIDVYALGAMLFRILTGEEPEESTNRKVVDNVPVPSELNEKIPEYISNAILKAMAVNVHLRFRTVEEFILALKKQKKVLDPKAEMKRRISKRSSSLVVFAVLLLGGLFFAGFTYNRQMDAITLPAASINLWYVVTGNSEVDENKVSVLKAIIEDFNSVYPNVSVSLKGIGKDQYENEVLNVLRRDKSPVVLESDILGSDILAKTVDISEIAKKVSKSCYFLDMYTRYFPDKHQLPVGFNVSAVYINPELATYGQNGVGNLSEILSTIPADISAKGIALNEQYKHDYESTLGGSYVLADRDSYFNGETGVYFSNTSEFYSIRKLMPARYKLLYIDSKAIHAEFNNVWSLLPCEGNERKAGERLLQYLLSENAQDQLHIRNQSGALPLNKTILKLYGNVYQEFDGFFTKIESYSFN